MVKYALKIFEKNLQLMLDISYCRADCVFTGRYGQIYRLGRWILVLIIMDYMCSKISFNKQSYNNYVA